MARVQITITVRNALCLPIVCCRPYTFELTAQEPGELLAYERVYHKLFLAAPLLGLSPEAPPVLAATPSGNHGPSEFADLSVKPSFVPTQSSSTASGSGPRNNVKSKFTEFKKSSDTVPSFVTSSNSEVQGEISAGESVDSSASEESEEEQVCVCELTVMTSTQASADAPPITKLGEKQDGKQFVMRWVGYRDEDEKEW